jgi:lysophospholipase L1-like esterase
MARFARDDQASPPPAGGAVFAGSSSFRMWRTLSADFPGVAVLNRGFGGAQVRDLAWHADQLAIRHAPRIVLLYAGDNDIDAGRSPRQVLNDVQVLVLRLRQALPDATIAFVAIKPSPARISQLAAQREANALVADWTRSQRGVAFIDVATPMLDASGTPREALFLDDRLHMNASGYALWREVIAPWLR